MDFLRLPPPRWWRPDLTPRAEREMAKGVARRRQRRLVNAYRKRFEADPRELLRYIVFCKDTDVPIESWARDELAEAFRVWLQEQDAPLDRFILGERAEQHARTVMHKKIIREAVKVIAIAGFKGDRRFELGSKLVDLYNCKYSANASSDSESMHTYYYTTKNRPTVDLEVRAQLLGLLPDMEGDIQAARDDIAAAKKSKKTPRK